MQHSIRNDYLSIESSNCLKGIFAIIIVICHMFGSKPFPMGFGLGTIITSFGYLSVAFFVFSSGYGLTISVIQKGNSYFKSYFRKRVLSLYLLNIILILIYALFKLLINDAVSVVDVVESFFFGSTVVTYGWYIQFILLFYIIFYLVFKKLNIERALSFLTIITAIYCLVCFSVNKSVTWYETSWLFPFGSLWAYRKEAIDKFFASGIKKYLLSLITTFIGFAICFVFGNSGLLDNTIRILFKMASAILFVTVVLILTMKVKINYKPITFFGKYYFEIYIVQGIFIVFFSKVIVIENMLIYYLLTFISIIVVAVLVNPVVKGINKICRGAKI
ncbi:MAG: acyltransferase family protein [Clostridia bacterium]|nr:acyltransferase family protein [Clostridia bacterium]